MSAGIVPVYVRLENSGSEMIPVAETDFYLFGEAAKLAAIPAVSVPREFTSIHGEAIAANAVNVTVVVAASIVVVALLVGIKSATGGFDFPAFSGSGSGFGNSSKNILNDTTLTKRINYRDYLLKEMKFQPGGVYEGLIFFRSGKEPIDGPLKLQIHLRSQKPKSL